MNGIWMGLCALLLLCFSAEAMQAARDAAQIFVGGVLPALFPMMVLCGLAKPATKAEYSGRGTNGRIVEMVFFSFAAGSPASSKRIAQIVDAGIVEEKKLPMLLAMSCVMSPMFFVGTLAGWTGLKDATWMMLFLHWVSAILTGAVCWGCERIGRRRSGGMQGVKGTESALDANSSSAEPCAGARAPAMSSPAFTQPTLTAAITSAAQSLLAVCGAMLLFSIVAALLRVALIGLFPAWTAAHAPLVAMLHALLEIGGGSASLLAVSATPLLPLLCALCSFGGLSIWLQNLLFVGTKIKPAKLLLIRALHGLIAYGLCTLIFRSFPMYAQALAANAAFVNNAGGTSVRSFALLLPPLLIALALRAVYPVRHRSSS